MHTSRKNLFLYLPILILFLASFIWVLKAPDHFSWSAELYLRNDDTSVLSQLFYSDNDELSQDNSTDGTRDGNIVTFSGLPDLRSLTLFRFDPTNTQESYRVTHVGFFLNGEAFFTMNAADLEAQAFPVNASWQLNGEELVFTPQNPDSSFLLSADSIREAAENAAARLHVLYVRQRFFLALSIALLLCVLLFFRNGIASYLKTLFLPDSSGHFDWFALISTAVIAGALLVVCIIGLFSALGLHPDEWDVKACLDYGMTHFLPPDMRDPAVAQTYSGYGYTKLENYTWYFYLAGKIALLFKTMFCSLAYYREPFAVCCPRLLFCPEYPSEKLAHGRTRNLRPVLVHFFLYDGRCAGFYHRFRDHLPAVQPAESALSHRRKEKIMPERYSCFSSFRAFVWQHRPRKAVLSRDSGAILLRPFAAADLAERPLTEKSALA